MEMAALKPEVVISFIGICGRFLKVQLLEIGQQSCLYFTIIWYPLLIFFTPFPFDPSLN
jgi:hypothetical protein